MKSQLSLLKKEKSAYGGDLLKTREGRERARPLDTRNTMHLVLRSTKAKGEWSFRKPGNAAALDGIITKFARKYGVKILSLANVGNHLHIHLKLTNRFGYRPFVRAITGAIAMAVTGASRWKKLKKKASDKFWDYRPFTRVVESFRAYLNLRDYVRINELEGFGVDRRQAREFVKNGRVVIEGTG